MALFEPTHVCKNCGNRVRPIVSTKLNGCFLIVLLFFFIIPGLLYWVWAGTQKILTCPKCKGQNTLVPLESPEGKRLIQSATSQVEARLPAPTRDERPCSWCAEPILAAARVCKHCGREVT
jgi:hypothetical protein